MAMKAKKKRPHKKMASQPVSAPATSEAKVDEVLAETKQDIEGAGTAPVVREPKVKVPRAKREPSLVCSCHGLPWTYSKSGTSRWCKEKDRELRLKAAAVKKPAAPAE